MSPKAEKSKSGRVDWNAVRVIMARDLTAVQRSKAVVVPMVAVPTMMLLVVPLMLTVVAVMRRDFVISEILTKLPGGVTDPILKLPAQEQLIVLVDGYLLAPLFLIVPMMVSAVLAADTFAGEKDRRTLESLLHLPVGDREVMLGKTLATFLPSIAVSWLGFAGYVVLVNSVAWQVTHRIFVPTTQWLIVIFWVGPAVAVVGLGVMVRVSARAKSSQEANQLGGAVVLPLIILAVGQSTGLLLLSALAAFNVGVVIWVIGLFILKRGARKFSRDALAVKV